MLELRSLLDIFKKNKPDNQASQQYTDFKMLNSSMPYFTNYNQNIYANEIVRSCIHAIASNAGKLNIKHNLKGVNTSNSQLQRVLNRPNPYMSTYDFIYKTVSLLYTSNNVFIYCQYDSSNKLTALYPINYSNVKLVEYQGQVFAQFRFLTGFQVTIELEQLIHLKRHYNENDMFGSDALSPLSPILSVLNTAYQGMENAIKNSAIIRGLIKFEGNYSEKDLLKAKNIFTTDYLNINNNGGIASMDAKGTYIPLDSKPMILDEKLMQFTRESIYRYFNISEKIITSNYTESEYNAFYNSVIESIAIQFSQEFTNKLFTAKEIGFDNQILFSSDRLLFASTQTKTAMIQQFMPLGLLSINEARQIMELSPINSEEADKHIISLNYVELSKQNEYQTGEKSTEQPKEDINSDTTE